MTARCNKCGEPIYLASRCGLVHCLAGCPTRWLHVDESDHRVVL